MNIIFLLQEKAPIIETKYQTDYSKVKSQFDLCSTPNSLQLHFVYIPIVW